MRRLFNILFTAAAALSLFACTREQLPADKSDTEDIVLVGNGPANLSLTLGTKADGQTLDAAKTLDDAKNGDAFENLLVIVTSNGKVVKRYYEAYSDYPTLKEITFTGLEIGSYQIWAYANIDNTDWTSSISSEDSFKEGSDFCSAGVSPDYSLYELNTLTGSTDTPKRPDNAGMFLTGKVDFQVGVGSNYATVELLRPVVDFNVYVNNKSEYPMTLTALSFSDFNASNTYLFDYRTNEGIPTLPSGNTYRSLPAFTGPVSIAAQGSVLAYSTLLYENAASSYNLSATMGLGGGATATPISYATLHDMTVGDANARTVLMVNPNKTYSYFLGYDNSTRAAIGTPTGAANALALDSKATSLASESAYKFKITKLKNTETSTVTRDQTVNLNTGSGTTGYNFTTISGETVPDGYKNGYKDKNTSTVKSVVQCVMKVTFKGYTEFSIKLNNYYSWDSNNKPFSDNYYSVIHVSKLGETFSNITGRTQASGDAYYTNAFTDGYVEYKFAIDEKEKDTEHSFWINHEYIYNGKSKTSYAKIWLPTYGTETISVDYYYYNIESVDGSYSPTGTKDNYTLVSATSSTDLISGISADNLISFKNGSQYLSAGSSVNNLGYSETEDAYTPWILYEIGSSAVKTASITNSQLKIIDNVTSQVTNLTYMPRNRKLNVILNAYYNESTSQFNFEVDNTYWTSGHTEAHTFK